MLFVYKGIDIRIIENCSSIKINSQRSINFTHKVEFNKIKYNLKLSEEV